MKGAFPELQPSLEANQAKALGVSGVYVADSKQVEPEEQVGRAWIWPQTCLGLPFVTIPVLALEGWDTGIRHSIIHRGCISKEYWAVIPVPKLTVKGMYL